MSALEHRYRRLLRWYPADHRRRHEEEMLGVLLAAADPGRERPTAGDTANLLVGAARIRLRRALRLSRQEWREGIGVASVAASLMLTVLLLAEASSLLLGGYFWPLTWDSAPGFAPALLSVGVSALVLRGARRAAAITAWTLVAVIAALSIRTMSSLTSYSGEEPVADWVIAAWSGASGALPLATAILLSLPTDPARTRELIARRGRYAFGLTAGVAAVCEFYLPMTSLPQLYQFVAPMFAAYWAGRAMASGAGRAAALMLAVPVMLALPSFAPTWVGSGGLGWGIYPHLLLAAALPVFAIVAARAVRRAAAREPSGTPSTT